MYNHIKFQAQKDARNGEHKWVGARNCAEERLYKHFFDEETEKLKNEKMQKSVERN